MIETPSVTTTILDPGRDFITLINVFTVKPGAQPQFIAAQTSEYKRLAGKIAGSLSANLHRGLGGTKAINYAQFHSVEEMRTWQTSDLMRAHLPMIRPYIERAEPGLYRAVEVISRDGRTARIEAGPGRLALVAVMFAKDTGTQAQDEVAAGQRKAAKQLLEEIPALRSLTLHRGVVTSGDGKVGGAAGEALVRTTTPEWALYAQLDHADAAHALIEHPRYRAWFTIEHPHIGRAEQEVYEVAYVQNEVALRAPRQ